MYTQEQKKLINADKLLEKLSNDVIWHSQWLIVKKAINELTKPMFEVGKCYKNDEYNMYFLVTKISLTSVIGYGLNDVYYLFDVDWTYPSNINQYTEIPREEFNKMLLEYAEKKYPKGTMVRFLDDGKIYFVNQLTWGIWRKNKTLSILTKRGWTSKIFDSVTGVWAEIIEEVEEPTIILKVPKGSNYIVEEV